LHDLRTRTVAFVDELDLDLQRLAGMKQGRAQLQVLIAKAGVRQPMTEWKERFLSQISVTVAVLATHLVVKQRLLADVTRIRDAELTARSSIAE
jgi:hypothetical protein